MCSAEGEEGGRGGLDVGPQRGPSEPNTAQTEGKREKKRQRDYYLKTKFNRPKRSRRDEESDAESNEPHVQPTNTDIFTTAQVESIRDIVYEYMVTEFKKDSPESPGSNTLVSGLLCGAGIVGIGSKILQNREAVGSLISDFLGKLGQAGPCSTAQSTSGGEAMLFGFALTILNATATFAIVHLAS